MKVTFPLSLKVSLWLLANLLLLATAGGALYVSQFGVGWNSLTRGTLGDQLQSIGDSIASDLNVEPEGVRPAIIGSLLSPPHDNHAVRRFVPNHPPRVPRTRGRPRRLRRAAAGCPRGAGARAPAKLRVQRRAHRRHQL